MRLTRVAGLPGEHFLPKAPDPEWDQAVGTRSVQTLVDGILREGSTPNGLFGTKLMWNYFPTVLSRLGKLPGRERLAPHELLSSIFPNLRYLWITRRDKVRQAVSWALAAQTNIYASFQLQSCKPLQEPEFDFQLIDNLHGLITEGEAGWEEHFVRSGVDPLRIVYEELAADYEGTARRALAFLDVTPLDPLLEGERTMARQATELNDRWVDRYLELKEAGRSRSG